MSDRGTLEGRSYLERATSPRNLFDAFETVRRNDESDGRSTRQLLGFLENPAQHLADLADEITGGVYRPQPLWEVEIPKDDGGVRRLSVPTFTDRVVERAVYQVLMPDLDPELYPSAFAYRVGLGVNDAVDALAAARDRDRCRFVARFDFDDCFDTLDHTRLMYELGRRVDDSWLINIVEMFLARPIMSEQGYRRQSGAAQGSVLSPLLANLYLHGFDEAMLRRGFEVIRYADDVAVPTRTKARAERALTVASEEAHAVGMSLNEDEYWVGSFEEGVDFIGTRFTDRVPPWNEDRVLSEPTRRSLFVVEQGTYLTLRKGQVRVLQGDDTLLAVPVSLVRQIVAYGRVQMSPWLRNQAMQMGIDLVFLSRNGRYMGSVTGDRHASDDVLPAQLMAITDLDRTRYLASQFVAGKIANMRALLARRSQSESSAGALLDTTRDLASARRRAMRADNLDTLRGIEGAATKRYWASFAELLPNGVEFHGRNRRPPRDPVNSLLSFGYTVLLPEIEGACRTAGLDPRYGFLHPKGRNRPSLALDLIEEFRPLIVDTTVLTVLNRGIIKPDRDFVIKQKGGCRISNTKARRAFLGALEKRLLTRFAHTPTGVRTSYRRALHLQARQLATVLLGLKEDYEPVMWR